MDGDGVGKTSIAKGREIAGATGQRRSGQQQYKAGKDMAHRILLHWELCGSLCRIAPGGKSGLASPACNPPGFRA